MYTFSNSIPGAAPSDSWAQVLSPYSGDLVGRVEETGRDGIEQALQKAQAVFSDKSRWLSPAKRIQILENTARIMQEEFDLLADIALSEGGKPLIDTRVEVARAIDGVHNCVECIRGDGGTEIPMGLNAGSAGRLAFTRKEPIGVVVALSAFNHPLNLIVHQVAPAVASGCPVIVKPAKDTALSCFKFVEILRRAGLPDEYCMAALTDSHATSEALVADSRVAFFSFIGSGAVGWRLRSLLAPGTRCALEHGGAAPVIAAADADLERAVPSILKGGFYHAGQVCVSVQRVFAHQSMARELAEQLAQRAGQLIVGDPADEKTEVGPLIRAAETDRIDSWVQEAVAAGAELLQGGSKISDVCYQPTVLFNPPADAKVSTQEIFGPVVCVYSYEDVDQAIAQANSLRVAFQAAVYTQDIDQALYIQRQLDAAAVMVNDHTAFRVDWMPFAGLRESGHGVGGIPHTFEDMQIEKMLVIQSPSLA